MRGGTAHAHYLLGRYDEASSWAAMALQDNADYQSGLRIAAASNAMAGRPEQAHKAVARLRQLNPALRVPISKTWWALGGPTMSRDMKKDCGKPGCPNDITARWSPCRDELSNECDFR
jgi:tetratricopeptide (TPR) repeat protein